MRVIGTAGHVDHGKSTLVAALTGINPDRLKEEQEREMTIDLGFAWLTLPDGEEVGIVDVPGHRDFIENMLAGIGGIDAVLFVIAADEGVMPQTREHLAVLNILHIKSGIIALTKVDLVDEPEWLELLEDDIHQMVRGTVLEDAPLVRVSARNKTGLSELTQALTCCLADHPLRPDMGRPRLPIDRVFTISGFGTVVTGTLIDGRLVQGEEVEILPVGLYGRIRGLQSHKRKEKVAVPGSRTAVNISGMEVEQIKRGDVLSTPGSYTSTRRLDVHFRLLSDASGPIKHNTEVKLFLGSSQVMARLRLLGVDEITPGGEAWLQLETQQPVVAVRGDFYILRLPSPAETLGGGVIVDAQPARRHKRFSTQLLHQLEIKRIGTPGEVILQTCLSIGAVPIRDLVKRTQLLDAQAEPALLDLIARKRIALLESGPVTSQSDLMIIAQPQWNELTRRALSEVNEYHLTYPLRRGMPREELKSRLKISSRLFSAALSSWVVEGQLMQKGAYVFRPTHEVHFSGEQKENVDRLMVRFAESPYAPPTIRECQAEVGDDVYNALVEMGHLIPVSTEVVFRNKDYKSLLHELEHSFGNERAFSVAQFRDQINTSRRYAIAFLEHLDGIGVTMREGDFRKLRNYPITVDRLGS